MRPLTTILPAAHFLPRRTSYNILPRGRSTPRLPEFDFQGRSSEDPAIDCNSAFDRVLEQREDGGEKDLEALLPWDVDKAETIVVSFSGPSDPSNPLNWSQGRKWTATLLVSCFTFISPFSSTMVAPALENIGADIGIPKGFQQQLLMTIFMLGFAQGPFVLAPLSEIFGRIQVLQYANLIYLVFNTACAFAKTPSQLLAFRFLSGIGGSAPQALCSGVLSDVWRKEERGKGQAIYGMLTFISPAVAPIAGAYISLYSDWRWIFWSTSIFDVAVQLGAFFFLRETYAPKILADKAARLRRRLAPTAAAGKGDGMVPVVRTEFDSPNRTWGAIARRRLILPFVMLFTHPAVQFPSLYRAFLYGIMYLVLSTFTNIWTDIYKLDRGTGSLHYLSLGIGFVIGLQISHPMMDKLYAHLKQQSGLDEGLPEWRVPPMLVGGFLAPIGLLMYGWGAQNAAHWIVPDLGCAILACGLIIAFQGAQAYVTDAYDSRYTASATAVGAFMRTMFGFAFPLFGPALYDGMGLGKGNTMLAFVALVVGVAGPIVLWRFGERIRGWSTRGLV